MFTPFWHYHPELELTLISKGEGTRFVGDSISSFSNFDLILVGENLPHHWVSITENGIKNHEAYVFQFDKNLFEHFPECNTFRTLFENAKRGIHFSKPKDELIKKIIAFEALSPISRLSALIEILQNLIEDNDTETLASEDYLNRFYTEGSQTKISKTTNYILDHLDQKLSVNQLAEFTHMVPQSFCRWFKKHSGHSFISFLNQTRIERVCHLLVSTNMRVQEIAFSCGFESLSHFNRTFNKLKHMSPRTYRQLNAVL
ncbi:helix-turn-helix domain-containing protein [Winogradskyella sp. 3972H.M.0a.05]|uniref:AraC family transcriptional regulator n=1 Tax=Winogradskyella sp. 3972H.M.0a.05 TaxID=2950277 RepID=UPI003392B2AE